MNLCPAPPCGQSSTPLRGCAGYVHTRNFIRKVLEYIMNTLKCGHTQRRRGQREGNFNIRLTNLSFPFRRISIRHYSTSLRRFVNGSLRTTDETSNDTPSEFVPVKKYANADTEKLQILKEANGKGGVYRWVNLLNGKTYIGSSVNLGSRLGNYYSIPFLFFYFIKKAARGAKRK